MIFMQLFLTTNTADCCSEGKFTAREHSDPKCASIPIPPNDPYNGPAGNECYNFYRSDSRNNIKPNDPVSNICITGYPTKLENRILLLNHFAARIIPKSADVLDTKILTLNASHNIIISTYVFSNFKLFEKVL